MVSQVCRSHLKQSSHEKYIDYTIYNIMYFRFIICNGVYAFDDSSSGKK